MSGEHADASVRLSLESLERYPLQAVAFESDPMSLLRASALAEKLSARFEDVFVDVGRRHPGDGITRGAWCQVERWVNGRLWRRSA